MLGLRKLVFYIFALLYLILCPLIVARMLGFMVNPLTHHLVKTGLVYISTNPPDATVYIDGRLVHQKTPATLRDLAPGEHFIRVEMEGYNDWEMNIPIVGKKATVLDNTLLIPEEWPIKQVSSHAYQDIIPADDDVLIGLDPVLKDIDIFHTTQGLTDNFSQDMAYQPTPLFSQNSIYAQGQLVHLYNTPLSPFILLEATIKDKHKFLWVNLKETPPLIEDISDLFAEIPARIAWDNADNENIFAFYPTYIYRINIKDKAIYPQEQTGLPAAVNSRPMAPAREFLINDKNDLLIREGRWIRIYPKEDFSPRKAYTIAQSRPSTNMYFEEKNGSLFYLDNDTRYLYTAQILPYHPILNIPIPDALRINSKKEHGL